MSRGLIRKTGSKVWKGEYRAFGELKSETGTWGNRLRFPGQYYDEETGNYYNYFRDYDPATGRYIQSDPIGLDGGLNTYAYVGSDPINKTDPLRLWFDGDDGDDGDDCGGIVCTNVLSVFMGAFHGIGSFLCVYNCNTTCPGTMDEIYVRVFILPPGERCPKYMRKEDL
jgi:RHS repeat-associated protein